MSNDLANPTNPLLEVDIKSLDAMMSIDPLTITDSELAKQVEILRKMRAKFGEDEAAGPPPAFVDRLARFKLLQFGWMNRVFVSDLLRP